MRDMVQVRRGPRKSYGGPDARIGRSQFNRSHGHKTTFDASRLVPILVDEVLPGDTFTCRLNGFCRILSPLDTPIMDNIELETFFFFTPTRLVWDSWEFFNGAHDAAGAQDTTYTIPRLTDGTTPVEKHSLANYFGIPIGTDFSLTVVSALPFRCMRLIYNEWFRDQNLIDSVTVDTSDSNDSSAYGDENTFVYKSGKRHDYFTSALPYLQKGSAVAYSADVIGDVAGSSSLGSPTFTAGDSTPAASQLFATSTATNPTVSVENAWTASETLHWSDPELIASIDINGLRQSVAIQRLLERDARGGTRYTELIKSHFGVTSPDFRLQRPEYLGGGRSYINVSPVANTSGVASASSPTGADEFPAQLRGVGTGIVRGHGWAKSFTEHGYIIGLVRARGDLSYFQGLDRLWSRDTRYDFYIPALANLGEQAILNKEIFVSNSSGTDDAVFGYQERWAEYRMKHSMITGLFSPDAPSALSQWHVAEDFAALPSLNQAFIEDNTPMSRVQVVTTQPDFALDIWFDYKCARPIPVYSIPSLVGTRF